MNLVLVGFMGSGKTVVGRNISRRIGYGFLDTDHFIEKELGRTIADIFSEKGEAHFRKLETSLAERLDQLDNYVIATGGGILTTPGNLDRLRRAGVVVFLKADPEGILTRLQRDTKRPKLREGDDLRETVERLLAERMPLYDQSDIVVETKGKNINRVVGEIIQRAAEFRGEARAASREPPDGTPPDGTPPDSPEQETES